MFRNKATGITLVFAYRGVEFVPWARGWGFLQLGALLRTLPGVKDPGMSHDA